MRRFASKRCTALLCFVFFACGYESPTAPRAEQAFPVTSLAESPHGITLNPANPRVYAGRSMTAIASIPQGVFASVTFHSANPDIAFVRGSIPPYSTEGVIEIFGIAPGSTDVLYNIPNFGRPGGSGAAGVVSVLEQPTYDGPCVPPVITQQPRGASVVRGESATLSVNLSGSPPLAYQWFVENDQNSLSVIGGATNRTYQTPPLFESMTYSVEIWNPCGVVKSDPAAVTILQKRRAAGS